VTGNDVTWPQVTGSEPEVTSFHRKSPGSGSGKPKTSIHCTFHFLQAVARRRRQSRDRKWRHVTSGNRKWPGSDVIWRKSPGSGCRRPKTAVCCRFLFLQGFNSPEEAVTSREMTSRDLRWPEVTRKWRDLTGSHLEVALEGRKLEYTVHFTSYNAVDRRRRQSCDRKWRHVTSDDGSDPEVTSFDRKSAGRGCRRPKTGYTVHFTSYKAVARRRQSRDRKWRHVTSGDRKGPGSDVI